VCAYKIAHAKADELEAVFRWAVEAGHTVAFLTLTMRHHAGQSLVDCWDAATAAWARVTSGYGWAGESEAAYAKRLAKWESRCRRQLKRGSKESAASFARRCERSRAKLLARRPERQVGIAETFEVLGFARGIEGLHGINGWHVHIHVPLILAGPVSEARIRLLGEQMYDRWERGLRAKGFTAIRDSGGLDIRRAYGPEDLSGYLVKSLSMEVTHGHTKTGRGRTELRAPFQILEDFQTTGDLDDLVIWHEWEQGSHGRKQLTWSHGLRQMAGLAAKERTDEEIALEDEGDETHLIFDREAWEQIAYVQIDLLIAGEVGGLRGAIAWLDQRSIEYVVTPAGRRRLEEQDSGPAP
jgi:hypothetical protein